MLLCFARLDFIYIYIFIIFILYFLFFLGGGVFRKFHKFFQKNENVTMTTVKLCKNLFCSIDNCKTFIPEIVQKSTSILLPFPILHFL